MTKQKLFNFNFFSIGVSALFVLMMTSPGFAQELCTSTPLGQDLTVLKEFQSSQPLGGGALVLMGKDRASQRIEGGAYFVYDGHPLIAPDRGAIALYPVEPNIGSSLSIAPSGPAAQMQGEDTASLGLQLDNGFDQESRFVAVMKKWGEMRFATINTGSNSRVIPMVHYVNNHKLLELTTKGQVNLYFKSEPIMTMSLPHGVVKWHAAQTPQVYQSPAEVKKAVALQSAPAGTEVTFRDVDKIYKKAIKQDNGSWLRVNNLKAL